MGWSLVRLLYGITNERRCVLPVTVNVVVCVEVIVQTRALDERIAGFERANRMWQLPKYFCVYYWWGLVS